jgi:glycosyltransferase involved in cell wall biosynthesis
MQITHDLGVGGLPQVVVNLCKATDKSLFDISVLCLRDLGEFASEIEKMGIPVFLLPQRKNNIDYFAFLKVAKLLRREKIDVIHTHNTQPFIDGTIGALMSGVKTIVHTEHGRTFPDKRRYMFAEWLMSHFAVKVVGVSENTSQNLIKYERISPKKVITIINGVTGAQFDINIDKEKKMKELGIKSEGPILGVGARLVKLKGISFLLQAMPAIVEIFPSINLIIAGGGDYENTLKKEVQTLGIQKNTLFVGPRLDFPELLKLFDLFILPSLSEGLPMALLEAMAAGCPIIATNVGGIPMAIKHGENGSLIEPGNAHVLSSEIIKLLHDNELRNSYVKKGREVFMKNFSADVMIEKYQRLYLREIAKN